jgi:hypothetical protein
VPPQSLAAMGLLGFKVESASLTLTTSSFMPGRNAIAGFFSFDTTNVCFLPFDFFISIDCLGIGDGRIIDFAMNGSSLQLPLIKSYTYKCCLTNHHRRPLTRAVPPASAARIRL